MTQQCAPLGYNILQYDIMRHSQYDRVLSSRSTNFHIAANVALREINCISMGLPLNIVNPPHYEFKCTLCLNIKAFHDY